MNPLWAVHLKIRRFPRSSEATMTHLMLVYIPHSAVFLRIVRRITIFLLILTRLLWIFAKCLTRGNEYCEFKLQREVRNKKTLGRIYSLSRSLKSSSEFSVKIRIDTSLWSWQWKFVIIFWALCHATLNERGAFGTCEGSSVADVKGEATFRTLNYFLSLRHNKSRQFNFQKRDSPNALLEDYGKHISSFGIWFGTHCLHYIENLFIRLLLIERHFAKANVWKKYEFILHKVLNDREA